MTIVSSKEFMSNENKYFDMAMTEEIFVKRENMLFVVTRVDENRPKKRLKPDDDLRRAITMDELREGVLEDIHQFYKNKREYWQFRKYGCICKILQLHFTKKNFSDTFHRQ